MELRPIFLLVPATVAVLAAWFLRRRTGADDARAAIFVWAWCGFLGALNTANLCNPGWCGSYGFPVPFYTWSDAVMIWNGEGPDHFHELGLYADLVVFVIGLVFVLRSMRQARTA